MNLLNNICVNNLHGHIVISADIVDTSEPIIAEYIWMVDDNTWELEFTMQNKLLNSSDLNDIDENLILSEFLKYIEFNKEEIIKQQQKCLKDYIQFSIADLYREYTRIEKAKKMLVVKS